MTENINLNRGLLAEPLPLLAFSFSSKGFPDVVSRCQATLRFVPSAYLFSLYDWKYLLQATSITGPEDNRIRIWDSGGYETGHLDDVSAVVSAIPQTQGWSKQLYIEAANSIPWNGKDILVNFDSVFDPPSIPEQARNALELYKDIDGNYLKDMLFHFSEKPDPLKTATELEPFLDQLDIVGFTEKEIAPTWIEGIRFMSAFRSKLDYLARPRYIPIHVFGCFDPKSIAYFSLTGADVFDGLTWHRYYFEDKSTLYRREFEFRVPASKLSTPENVELSLILHNIRELERLNADLVYARTVDDYNEFDAEMIHLNEVLAQ